MDEHQTLPCWTCPRCGQQVEEPFEQCWQCGSDRQGRPDERFEHLHRALWGEDEQPRPRKALSASARWTVRTWIVAALSALAGGLLLIADTLLHSGQVGRWWPVGWVTALAWMSLAFSFGAVVAGLVLVFWPLRAVEKPVDAGRGGVSRDGRG